MRKNASENQQTVRQIEFDFIAGEYGKAEGIARASEARAHQLGIARSVAKACAMKHPERLCSIDDVQRVILQEGIHLGMAAGGVFREKCWEFSHLTKSMRKTNHVRPISVWKYVG